MQKEEEKRISFGARNVMADHELEGCGRCRSG